MLHRGSVTLDESLRIGSPVHFAIFHTLLSFWAHGFLLSFLLHSPSNMLTTWLITSLILPTATTRKGVGGCHPNKPFSPCKCFLYCSSVCLEALAARALRKPLNNRSSEAVGRCWHLSPITVEPPFTCHRPDQPVSHIYDLLSVVTSVKRVPSCLTRTQILTKDSHPELGSWLVPEDLLLLLRHVVFWGCIVVVQLN